MRLIIHPSADAVANWAAHQIKQRIDCIAPTSDRPFVLGLPTGSTPLKLYSHLIDLYQQEKLSFKHVVTFNMDEYVGLADGHPQSYRTYMFNTLFSHIDIPKEQVFMLNGNAPDLERECQHYEDTIRAFGGVDLFIGGVGEDGHIAFNEPGASLASRTHLKPLCQRTRAANARFFNHDIDQVPKWALTVGLATVMDAVEVMILVQGSHKGVALQHAIEGGVNHLWPISTLQLHPRSLVVCDQDATVELKVKTVRYFTALEQDSLTLPHLGPTVA